MTPPLSRTRWQDMQTDLPAIYQQHSHPHTHLVALIISAYFGACTLASLLGRPCWQAQQHRNQTNLHRPLRLGELIQQRGGVGTETCCGTARGDAETGGEEAQRLTPHSG